MCGECNHHEHGECLCKRICGMVKLILAGAILGTIAGMFGMYFFDHDKCMQRSARKMLQGAEDFTRNVKSKISETENSL